MLSKLMSIISVLRALIDLFKYLQNWIEQQRKIEAAKRQEALEQAVDESLAAETDEDIWNAQNKIVSNKPR
mgnify:CR=1 FL=1